MFTKGNVWVIFHTFVDSSGKEQKKPRFGRYHDSISEI